MEADKKDTKHSKIKLLDRKERVDIFSGAAKVGQLTRLDEYVVEQVAGPREVETHHHEIGRSAAESAIPTSHFLIAIQEAAELGKMRRLKPVVIENFKEREQSNIEMYIPTRDMSRISKFLAQEKQQKSIETPLERAERIRQAMENVNLLKPTPIKGPQNIRRIIPLKMREDVARLAAKESTDRMARMKDEQKDLKVTFQCQCPHCKNASPFQTNFYSKIHKTRLQRVKSQHIEDAAIARSLSSPVLEVVQEDEVVDERLARLRKQVEASIHADEERRKVEIEQQAKTDKQANIQAAKALLEKSLFQPKPKKEVVKKEETKPPTSEDVNPEVLYGNTFGKAATGYSGTELNEVVDEDEGYRLDLEEQTEQEDLRQLTELYVRQDAGEKVDGERIYELELFDRSRRGGYLNDQEQKDLDIVRKRRIRTDIFIEEYEDVMYRYNNGESIDEHRAYQLEYVVKKRGLSQELTMNELSGMILFETEEYKKDGLDPADFKTSYTKTADSSGTDELSTHEPIPQLASIPQAPASSESLSEALTITKSDEIEIYDEVPDATESSVGSGSSQTDADDDSSHSSVGSGSSQTDADYDSSLSSFEVDELNTLMDLQEKGEDRDQGRLHDLDLFEKWRYGEELSNDEMKHLNAFRNKRRIERVYRKEFENLLELQETGRKVDLDRFHHLQLYARRQVGENLTKYEMLDLEAFEREEEKNESPKERNQQQMDQGEEDIREGVQKDDFDHVSKANMVLAEESVGASSGSLIESASGQERKESEETKSDTNNAFGSKDSFLEDFAGFDENAFGAPSPNGKKMEDKNNHVNDTDSYEDAVPSEAKDSFPSEQRSNNFESEGKASSNDLAPQDIAASASKDYNGDTSIAMPSHIVSVETRSEFASGKAQQQLDDDGDNDSFLSPAEIDELKQLLNDNALGHKVDQEHLYQLKVLDKWRRGGNLNDDEKRDLEVFRKQRRNTRRYMTEFEDLLERSDNGENVDDDRIFFLQLFARRHIGEDLTAEEMLDLEEFEEDDRVKVTENPMENLAPANQVGRDERGVQIPKHVNGSHGTSNIAAEKAPSSDQALLSVVIGDDENSFLSLGEVDELEELLEHQAQGEDFEKDHLQKLQLLYRWGHGDALDDSERKDLAHLRQQRRKDRYYKEEFWELLGRSKRGEEVNEDRIHFLQLYARRLVGEYLSFDELLDLEEFEKEERVSFEKEENIMRDSSSKMMAHDQATPPVMNGESGKPTYHEDSVAVVTDATSDEDPPGFKGKLHRGGPQQDNTFGTLSSKDLAVPSASSTCSETREESIQNHSQVENDSPNDAVDEGQSIAPDRKLYADAGDEHNSFLSVREVNELGKLFEAQTQGQEIDLERLQRLELLGRWQRGEDLNDDERKTLEVLRDDRRMYRRLKQLLEVLLERRHSKGVEVDDDDVYFLQLYVRRFSGEELLLHELSDLEELEEEGKAKVILRQHEGIVKELYDKLENDDSEESSSGTSVSDDEAKPKGIAIAIEKNTTSATVEMGTVLKPRYGVTEDEIEAHYQASRDEIRASLSQFQSEMHAHQRPSQRQISQLESQTSEETPQDALTANLRQFQSDIKWRLKPENATGALEKKDADPNPTFGVTDDDIEAHYQTPRNEIGASLLQFQSEMRSKQRSSQRRISQPPPQSSEEKSRDALSTSLLPFQSKINARTKQYTTTTDIRGQEQDQGTLLTQPSFSHSINTTESTDSYGFNELAKEKERENQNRKLEAQLHIENMGERERVKQLQAARQAAQEAEVKAKEEAAKRVAAEETAKKAEAEARDAKKAVSAVELEKETWEQATRQEAAKRVAANQRERNGNKQLATVEEASEEMSQDGMRAAAATAAEERQKLSQETQAEERRARDRNATEERKRNVARDDERRAQERRARARKTVEERKRRAEKQGEMKTATDQAEEERRERTRRAVEERKGKAREAMQARKAKTCEKAMEKLKSSSQMSSTGEVEAIEAAERAGQILKGRKELIAAPSFEKSKLRVAPPVRTAPDPLIQGIKQRASAVVIRVVLDDPPVHSSDDPPGIHYDPPAKTGTDDAGTKQRDAPIRDIEMVEVIVVQKSINGHPASITYHTGGDKDGAEDDDELTHEDWYAKMEKIAMSQTYAEELGGGRAVTEERVMSQNDWYKEIEALSKSAVGEATDEDEDMKRAIDEAQRNAQASNLEVSDGIDEEMKEDIEEIRREVRKMSKSEAVNQILQKVSSDTKGHSKLDSSHVQSQEDVSAFPDLASAAADDIAYSMASLSEDTAESGDFELRSHQTSVQNEQEGKDLLDMTKVTRRKSSSEQISRSNHTARSQSKSAPAGRKVKNLVAKVNAPKRNLIIGKKPNRMQNISWMSSPADSFSDWRVEIQQKETVKVDVYNLHRNVLGYGARKSEYFAKQFQEDRVVNGYYAMKSPKVTQLDLPEAWANLFPLVLDFLYYNRDKQSKLTAERACALFKWAEFLEIPALMNAIAEFYAKHISLKNFDRFMSSAVQMKAGRLVMAAKSKIGSLVTAQPHLAWRVAPQFLSSVLEVNRKELIAKARFKDPRIKPQAFQRASFRWSKAIYTCVKKNKRDMNLRLFEDLTTETALPVIDPSVALQLLNWDVEFRGDSEYSSFQKRCVESILQNWETFRGRYASQEKMTAALQKLPSDVLAEILILSNRSKSNPQTAI